MRSHCIDLEVQFFCTEGLDVQFAEGLGWAGMCWNGPGTKMRMSVVDFW